MRKKLTSDIGLAVALAICRVTPNVSIECAGCITVTRFTPNRISRLKIVVTVLTCTTITGRNVIFTATLTSILFEEVKKSLPFTYTVKKKLSMNFTAFYKILYLKIYPNDWFT